MARRVRTKARGRRGRAGRRQQPPQRPESTDPEYVHFPLMDEQIPIAEVERFVREVHVWVANGFDMRILLSFPESEGWLTRPRFAGGPSIQVKLMIRKDQFDTAKEALPDDVRDSEAKEAAAATA